MSGDAESGLRDLPWRDLVDRLGDGGAARSDPTAELERRQREAWAEFYRRVRVYAALARQWSSRLSAADLEDVAQDVAMQFLSPSGLERLRMARTPGAYVLAAVRNRALNLLRSQMRRARALDALEQQSEVGEEPAWSDLAGWTPSREIDALQRALLTLAEDDRELLRDRFWRGRSLKQIAEQRKVTYSSVAVRFFRLVRLLRARLGVPEDGYT